jgi:hypothetical protein
MELQIKLFMKLKKLHHIYVRMINVKQGLEINIFRNKNHILFKNNNYYAIFNKKRVFLFFTVPYTFGLIMESRILKPGVAFSLFLLLCNSRSQFCTATYWQRVWDEKTACYDQDFSSEAKAYFSLLISSSESVIFNLKKLHN